MIIDSHAHLFGWDGEAIVPADAKKNLSELLREMKAARVDHAFIMASYRRNCVEQPDTEAALTAVGKERRVNVIGSIDPLHMTKRGYDNLDDLLAERKIVGVKLYLGYQHFYPNSSACEPIYKLCLKHGVPVVFHTGDTLSGPGEVAKVKYAHPLGVDEVAADHPNLKIVIAHMGNPWLMDCAEVLCKNENVYADISGLILEDGISWVTAPYGRLMRRQTKDLMDYCSPRKLLYGTDWPLAGMRGYLKFVNNLGIGKKDMEYVMYRNAKSLFDI